MPFNDNSPTKINNENSGYGKQKSEGITWGRVSSHLLDGGTGALTSQEENSGTQSVANVYQ